MQVVAKTHRIELKMKGDIPARIIKALEDEYGDGDTVPPNLRVQKKNVARIKAFVKDL